METLTRRRDKLFRSEMARLLSKINTQQFAAQMLGVRTAEREVVIGDDESASTGGVVVSALDFRSEVRWYHGRRVVSLDKKLCPVMNK